MIILAKSETNINQHIDIEGYSNLLSQMSEQLGNDLTYYSFQIDMYAIRHIFKAHSNPQKEESRGQVVVTEDDIMLVLDVLEDPDLFFMMVKADLEKIFLFFKNKLEIST